MKKILLILIYMLFLVACGDKVEYRQGFPDEPSPALDQYIENYISSDVAYHLVTNNNQHVYALANLNSDEKNVEYVQFTNAQLKDFYTYLLDADELEVDIFRLREKSESTLYQTIEDTKEYHLPEFTMENGNKLNVKTDLNEKELDLTYLLEKYGVTENTDIIFNIIAVNEESFQLNIKINEDGPPTTDVSLFITQDLENNVVTKTYTDEFPEDIKTGNLELYKSLFMEMGSKNQYIMPVDTYSTIADTEENELRTIDSTDQLSRDNKYVYVGGGENPLKEGTQQIQKTEDYLEGKEKYYAEFELDYDEIAKELDFKSVGISIAKIIYFNEDFVVLDLEFKGAFTGSAGSANVMIDLQDSKSAPTYYLLDL